MVVVWISFLTLPLAAVSSLQCLSCLKIADVRNCQHLEKCAPNQKCFIYRFNEGGKQLYSLGCIDIMACAQTGPVGKRGTNTKDSALSILHSGEGKHSIYGQKRSDDSAPCLECCDSADGCNTELCSAPKTNLRCVECNDAIETSYCNKLAVCGKDEYCFIQRSPNKVNFELRYEMGCMGFQQCNALPKTYEQYCTTCCNDTDLCNYAACDHWSYTGTPGTAAPSTTVAAPTQSTLTSAASTTTTTTIKTIPTTQSILITTLAPLRTTEALTTATTIQHTNTFHPTTSSLISTTPAPQLVIKGPQISSYLSKIELECITVPPASTYIWKYNNSSILPQGVIQESIINIEASLAGLDKLVISKLNDKNAGTYTCIAIVNGHLLEHNYSLTLKEEMPSVSIVKPNVTTNFALICNVTGYPPPHIGWAFVKSGAHTPSVDLPPDVSVTVTERFSILAVAFYKPEVHDGSWYCAARNRLGDSILGVDIP